MSTLKTILDDPRTGESGGRDGKGRRVTATLARLTRRTTTTR